MIPYTTLEDAAAALGRNLTWFETMWFDFAATKSNFYIYCHTFLLVIVIYTLVPLPVAFVEFSRSFDGYKFQPKVKYSFFDVFWCYIEVIKMLLLKVSTLQLVFYPAVQMIGIRSGLPLPSLMEIIAQLLVYLLIEDFGSYWIHRLLHSKWCYDKIHHIHHKYTAPNGYATLYAHWGEILVQGTPTIIAVAIVPGHFVTFWLLIALRQIEAIDNHSGYDFLWKFKKYIPFYGGSEYHDYHHYVGGQSQSNFASLFTYCDYIYRTNKGYQIHKKHIQLTKESKQNRSRPEE